MASLEPGMEGAFTGQRETVHGEKGKNNQKSGKTQTTTKKEKKKTEKAKREKKGSGVCVI